jgi:hypothetical protein
MKSRTGLILGLLAAVLIFILSITQIIEAGTVILRVLIVFALAYAMGLGLDFFFKKYIAKALENNEHLGTAEEDSVANVSRSEVSMPEPGKLKGRKVDFKVGSTEDSAELASMATDPSAKESSSGSAAEGVARPRTVLEKRFEVNDKFILIDDKKLANNPELLASAIKTKMEE